LSERLVLLCDVQPAEDKPRFYAFPLERLQILFDMLLQRQRKASERWYERLFCAGRVQDAVREIIGGFYSYAASRELLQL